MKCDLCNSAFIRGILCHRYGCPNNQLNKLVLCNSCGITFKPDIPERDMCLDCWEQEVDATFSLNSNCLITLLTSIILLVSVIYLNW